MEEKGERKALKALPDEVRKSERGCRGSEKERKLCAVEKRGLNGVKRWPRSERKGCWGFETLVASTKKRFQKPSSLLLSPPPLPSRLRCRRRLGA